MLAIIIPYYKLTFFEATLQSLADQTNKQFKVYIGNDASSENPDFLLQKFETLIDFQYKKFEDNLGSISLVKQWERCMKLAQNEEWTMILGDDDYLENNVVAAFYENLPEINREKINVIRFATQTIQNGIFSEVFFHQKTEKATDFIINKFKEQTRGSLSEHIFKTEKLKQVSFKEYPLAWHSDDMAILQVADFKNIFTINEAKAFINISNESISGNKNNKVLKCSASVTFFSELIKKYPSHFTKEQVSFLVKFMSNAYFGTQNLPLFLKIVYLHLKYNSVNDLYFFVKKQIRKLV